jgi:hypothetical protein
MSWQAPWAGGPNPAAGGPNPPGASPGGPGGPPVGPYPPSLGPPGGSQQSPGFGQQPPTGSQPPYGGGPPPPGGFQPPPVNPPGRGVKPPSGREEREARALRALPPPPNPPPGMGAIPAFAPPVPRRDHTVLIVTLALGVTLLLCCGLGTTGVVGVVYSAYRSMQSDAVQTVDGYLGDLRNGQYTSAYGRLCSEVKAGRSVSDFTSAEQQAGQVTTYRVGSEIKAGEDGDWVVTAEVVRAGQAEHTEDFPVVFDKSNKPLVCPR